MSNRWTCIIDHNFSQYNAVPPTPGGSRLQAKGGRSVRTSVLVSPGLITSEVSVGSK